MHRSTQAPKADFWKQGFEDHARSRQPVSTFCKLNDLSVQSFYQWRRKLKAPIEDSKVPGLIPVKIVPPSASPASQMIQLTTPSGFTLRFDAAIAPAQPASLIDAIDPASRGASC